MAATKKQRSAISDVVTREYTIHLHKRVCRSYGNLLGWKIDQKETKNERFKAKDFI